MWGLYKLMNAVSTCSWGCNVRGNFTSPCLFVAVVVHAKLMCVYGTRCTKWVDNREDVPSLHMFSHRYCLNWRKVKTCMPTKWLNNQFFSCYYTLKRKMKWSVQSVYSVLMTSLSFNCLESSVENWKDYIRLSLCSISLKHFSSRQMCSEMHVGPHA